MFFLWQKYLPIDLNFYQGLGTLRLYLNFNRSLEQKFILHELAGFNHSAKSSAFENQKQCKFQCSVPRDISITNLQIKLGFSEVLQDCILPDILKITS